MRRHLIVIIPLLFSGCFYVDSGNQAPEEPEIKTEREIVMTKALKVKEYPFYWASDSGSIRGFKDGELEAVEFKAEKTEGGVKTIFDIKPKAFFTVGNALYFSADFTETTGEGEEAETATVEKYFEQVKGGQPAEISNLPSKPAADFYVGNDGRYDLQKNQYQEVFVSDISQLTSARFNRNLKVSNYFYSGGAWIDVQEGLPGVRDAGLYFWADSLTMINKAAEKGRMWRL